MDATIFDTLKDHARQAGLGVREGKDAIILTLDKDDLNFRITVDTTVLEWFLDIEEPRTGLKFHEWADYAGYDSRSEEELAEEMRDHLFSLLEAIQSRPFRLIKKKYFLFSKVKCEWNIDGEWLNFDEGEIVK